jgi:O-antigen ligase
VKGDQKPRPELLGLAASIHVCILLIGVTWAFGGNADWVRTPISLWASLGIVLYAVTLKKAGRGKSRATLVWAIPVCLLSLQVLLSAATPGFKVLASGNGSFLMPVRVSNWIPSAARPESAVRELWLFDGLYFSCLTVAAAVTSRRMIRLILAVAVGNAFALSIFGTVQKLAGSEGIYFGAIKSPQDYFFASFVYDNHWGAFIILTMGACVGLVIRYLSLPDGRSLFQGPAFLGLIATITMTMSVPLSGARICTALLGILLVAGLMKGLPVLVRNLEGRTNATTARFGIAIAIALFACFAWAIDGTVIRSRATKTADQIATLWAQGGAGTRGIVYRDTWRMAKDRPIFGWGMASFPLVFHLYSSQQISADHIPIVYHDAHSDWLQSVSEIGFVGSACIAAAALLPVAAIRKRRLSPVPFFLFAGCVIVLSYALVEFPFGNVAVVLTWWLCLMCGVQYSRIGGPPAGDAPSR